MQLDENSGFILASGSLRRQEILSNCGLPFSVIIPAVDESIEQNWSLEEAAIALAKKKTLWVSQRTSARSVIIGADTLVGLDERILGKPKDRGEAREMLKLLSGSTHNVTTGLCVYHPDGDRLLLGSKTTGVKFRTLSDGEIDFYTQNNNVTDWAGGYAIQGTAAYFIDSISGDYLNVVGLSVSLLYEMLLKIGFDLQKKKWVN